MKIKNEKLYDRLFNWKFTQALQYLDEKQEEKEVVVLTKALAMGFGDCGWQEGCMADIVQQALNNIGVNDDD